MVVNYQYEDPYLEVTTPVELDRVLDHLRQLSIDSGGYGILGTAHVPDSKTGLLDIGSHGDKGFVHYSLLPVDLISHGDDLDGMVSYWFQDGHESELPASAEIPYGEVRKAVHEFMATEGGQPSNITWQPYE